VRVQRLELMRVRVCRRCGRGKAELAADGGATLTIPLDAMSARELSARPGASDMRSLAELVLEKLAEAREVVLDVDDGVLRALLSHGRGSEVDVVTCAPQEGLGIAVRGKLKLYATDEAIALVGEGVRQDEPETLH
jgi:hypothetical protein